MIYRTPAPQDEEYSLVDWLSHEEYHYLRDMHVSWKDNVVILRLDVSGLSAAGTGSSLEEAFQSAYRELRKMVL